MASPSYSILFSAQVSGTSGGGSPGDVLIPISAGLAYINATAANRGTRRATGVALTSYAANGVVEIQQYGQIDAVTANLGAGTASWVRVSAAGVLERCTPSGSDDVCGWVEADGTFHACFGVLTAGIVNGSGGGATLPINLAGGAGVVTGVLPTANQAAQALAGDATGTTAAVVNTQARGLMSATTTVAVSAATAPTSGQVLTATSGTAATWQTPSGGGGGTPTGTGFYHTTAGAMDPAAVALTWTGDATGTGTGASNALTVVKINGASVPASGALVTGNAPYVSGVSALTYSALNLAGGSGWVTGVLPIGNVASPTGTGVPHVVAGVMQAAASLVSMTADVTGVLPLANGGTNASSGLTTANGVVTSSGTALQQASNVLAGTNFVSIGATPALSGAIRTPTTASGWLFRDASNANDLNAVVASGDNLYLGTSSSFSAQVVGVNLYATTAVALGLGGSTYQYIAGGIVEMWRPVTGSASGNSPYGAHGMTVHAMSVSGATDTLTAAEYKNYTVKVTTAGTSTNIIKFPAATDATAYTKFVWNATGGGLAVQDTNSVAAAANLGLGQGAVFQFSTSAVKQLTAAFTVA